MFHLNLPRAIRVWSAGDSAPKKNTAYDELKPPREATLAMLDYAMGQKAIWDSEVERIRAHLQVIEDYEARHPKGKIAPGGEAA